MGVSEAESDRPIQIDKCLIKRPLVLPQDSSVVEYGGVVWINADRFLVVGESMLEHAHFIPRVAADIVGLGVIRIEPDRLIEVDDRWREITVAVEGDSLLSVEIGIVRQ